MGNAFGNIPESGFHRYLHPEVNPSPVEEPTFDPHLGFEAKRKERGKFGGQTIESIITYTDK